MFVEENSRSRELRAQDTSEFISLQLRASEDRLNALEGRLRTLKEAYMGRLPEQTNANLSMVDGTAAAGRIERDAIRGEQDRLSLIERQIEAMGQRPRQRADRRAARRR